MSKIVYDPERCAELVSPDWTIHARQCRRKAVRDGRCKQHHPDAVIQRDIARQKLAAEAAELSPYGRLIRAKGELLETQRALFALVAAVGALDLTPPAGHEGYGAQELGRVDKALEAARKIGKQTNGK